MQVILKAENDLYGHLTISRVLDFFNQDCYPTPMARIASDQCWKDQIMGCIKDGKYNIDGIIKQPLMLNSDDEELYGEDESETQEEDHSEGLYRKIC